MLTREQCIKEYGSDYNIRKKVASGEIYKLDKSVYSQDENVPDIALFTYKYPNAVVTMNTAFYLYSLTDVIPDKCYLATKRDAAKIRDDRIRQVFVPDELFSVGIENMDYKGYPVPIYNRERMLVELLRYKTKLPFDYYKEILLNYRKILPKLNIQKIQDYVYVSPKSNHIFNTLQLEVL